MLLLIQVKSLEYLHEYYDFDSDIVAAVGEAAEHQDRQSYTQLVAAYDVEANMETVRPAHGHKPIEVATFKPTEDYDETALRVYHLPMANPLSENMIMNGLRLFGSDPSQPLMLVGNPSNPGHGTGKVSLQEAVGAWHRMDLAPYVEPLLEHLYESKISNVTHLGYSYGADKALAATTEANRYDQIVQRGVYAEPVSVASRGLLRLAFAFAATNGKLKEYISQAESEPYQAIRDEENFLGLIGYSLGLLRISNLAIGSVLAHESFEKSAENALREQPTTMTMVWGTASELARDDALRSITTRLGAEHGKRVQSLRLQGMHHAGANDINLHAAFMLQGLRDIPAATAETH